MSFELSPEIDRNKIFLVYRSELQGRLDPVFNLASIRSNLDFAFPAKALSKLCVSSSGGTPSKANTEYWSGSIPWASPKDMNGIYLYDTEDKITEQAVLDSATTLVPANSVLVVVRSGILKHSLPVTVTTTPTAINQDLKALMFDKRMVPAFAAHYLDIFQEQLLPLVTKHGATVQSVNTEQFDRLMIPMPALEIQNRLVRKMDAAYTVKKRKEAQAQQLLDSVDNYLLAELGIDKPEEQANTLQNRIFYQQLSKVSEARFDPEYFRQSYEYMNTAISKSKHPLKKLKDVCAALLSGKTPSSLSYSEEKTDFPIVKVSTYSGQEIDLSKVSYTLENQALTVKKGDTFILSAAHQSSYVGRFIKYLDEAPEIPTSYVGELICVRPSSSVCNTLFVFSLLSTELYKNLLNREKRGQTSHIYPRDIGQIKIPLPPLGKQDEIANHIALVRQKAKQLQQEASEGLEQAKREVEAMILGEATVEL